MARARTIALWVLAFGLAICWGLFLFFPAFPKSATGWIALVFIGVPLCFIGELFGEWFFHGRHLAGWPRWLRIVYGVMAAIFFLALLVPPLMFVQGLISS